MIVFVGSNPSKRSSVSNSAFDLSTRSGQILASWIRDIDAPMALLNVSDNPTDKNRPLTSSELRSALPSLEDKLRHYENARVVALGKTAAKALNLLGITFYEMPHPSGLNRKLNCKIYVETMLKGLHDHIK